MRDKLEKLYGKTGGFIKGICHPNDDCELLKNAGFGWVRRDIPFPYDKSGKISKSYVEYKERCEMFARNGINCIIVTPYPSKFIEHGIDVTTPEGLKKASEICAFMAKDYKSIKTCWQVTNEMHVRHFRAPLNENQAKEFLIACINGMKKGNPEAAIGHNSLDDEWLGLCVEIEKATGGCDYIGADIYDGTWSDGGPDTYCEKIDKIAEKVGIPVILMEFGFASAGGIAEDIYKEADIYLKGLGFKDIKDATEHIDQLIKKLPARAAENASRCAPEDRIQCVAAFIPHILKKWSGKGTIPHTEEGQAEFYAELLPKLFANPNLGGAVIYCLEDSDRCFLCGEPDCPCETAWGIIRNDGTCKPSYEAIKNIFTKR